MPRKKESNPLAPIYLANGGIIRPTAFGTYIAEINRPGSRVRKTWKSLAKAEEWIANTLAEAGASETPLTPFQLRDAREAYALLPAGVRLVEVAKAWIGANVLEQVSLQTAFDRFLAARKGTGRRPLTLRNYEWRMAPLLKQLGEEPLAAATPDRLEAILGQWQGKSRWDFLTTWRTFFRWAVTKGLLGRDPTDTIEQHYQDERIPLHLSARDCRRLLRAAQLDAPAIVPALAVALFAGLRPYELLHLQTIAIRDGQIVVDAAASKIRQRRYVAIEPTLAAWLKAYPPPPGKLISSHSTWRRYLKKARKTAGLTVWSADVLRHTFATFHVARAQDATATAAQMGNSPNVIFKSYRGLADAAEAARFWQIIPRDLSRFRPTKL